jgi:hypothetical protein
MARTILDNINNLILRPAEYFYRTSSKCSFDNITGGTVYEVQLLGLGLRLGLGLGLGIAFGLG